MTVRGDKKAIAAAKAAVLAVAEQVGDEVQEVVVVDPKYVRFSFRGCEMIGLME